MQTKGIDLDFKLSKLNLSGTNIWIVILKRHKK